MPSYRLSKSGIKKINDAIEALYERAKARIIGPHSMPKGVEIRVRPDLSLTGIFHAAAQADGAAAEKDVLDGIVKIAEAYIDAAKEKVKAQTIHVVQSTLRANPNTDLRTVLNGHLSEVWDSATTAMQTIVAAESNTAKNVGSLEGITKANAFQGVSDPVVFFVVVKDGALCSECRRLHLMPDGVTPRLWYMSEVGSGYHKKGDATPKIAGLHPHCRCALSTLMPGYGFDSIGHVTYVANGHSEIEKQRAVVKSEPYVYHNCDTNKEEPLAKSTREGLKYLPPIIERSAQNAEKARKDFGTSFHPEGDKMAKLTEHFQSSPLVVHVMPGYLQEIGEKGRFRNLFETNHGLGNQNKRIRANWEHSLFGFDRDFDVHPGSERPVYGALHVFHESPRFLRGPAEEYGDSWVQLKEHVKKRTTFTPSDSSNHDADEVQHFDHLWPAIHEYLRSSAERRRLLDWQGKSDTYEPLPAHAHPSDAFRSFDNWAGYFEAQIHGGVYMEDIDSIHLPLHKEGKPVINAESEKRQQVMDFAKKHGIKLFYHGVKDGNKKTYLVYDPQTKKEDHSYKKDLNPLSEIRGGENSRYDSVPFKPGKVKHLATGKVYHYVPFVFSHPDDYLRDVKGYAFYDDLGLRASVANGDSYSMNLDGFRVIRKPVKIKEPSP